MKNGVLARAGEEVIGQGPIIKDVVMKRDSTTINKPINTAL